MEKENRENKEIEATDAHIEGPTSEPGKASVNEPNKFTKALAVMIGAIALGGLLFIQLNRLDVPGGGVFDKTYSEQTWAEEAFRSYSPVESTLMDSSVLDVNASLKEWYEEKLETEGVYAMADDAHTYILATGGVENKGSLMQLFDIVNGKGEFVVGYSFLNPDELGIEPTTDIPNLILRIDKTEKKIVGRFIAESVPEEK